LRTSIICNRCVLPNSFPGIRFNERGICTYCLDYEKADIRPEQKTEYREKFEALVKELKNTASYDVLMCFSGGKDSTYTLSILKEKYDLNILALTVDNGFVAEQTRRNISKVVEELCTDHFYFKPRFDVLSKIFSYCARHNIYPSKAIERASEICTSCMGIIKYNAIRFALEKNIPLIAFGWSPGQATIAASIIKNNPQMVKKMQAAIYDNLHEIVGNAIDTYFITEQQFNSSRFPYFIHPLAFLDYNEDEIYRVVASLGWINPTDVDANSTNCLLNSFANVVHKQRFGFHPYAFEMANLVRDGYLDRTTALRRLNQQENPDIVTMVMEKLGIKCNFFSE